jgi:hypothetical protein
MAGGQGRPGVTPSGIQWGKIGVWSNNESLDEMKKVVIDLVEKLGHPDDPTSPVTKKVGDDEGDDDEKLEDVVEETDEVEDEDSDEAAIREDDEEQLDEKKEEEVVQRKHVMDELQRMPWTRRG